MYEQINYKLQQLERARLELLDMGLRANPQLNYRSGSKALDIIDEKSASIFQMLVEQESPLGFLPLPEAYQQKIADSEDEGTFFQHEDETFLTPLGIEFSRTPSIRIVDSSARPGNQLITSALPGAASILRH